MALTTSQLFRTTPGADFLQVQTVAFDTSYPTGGYVVTPSQLGLNVTKAVISVMPANTASALWDYFATIVYTNGVISSLKIGLNVSSTGVEVANAASVSGASVSVVALGS